MKKRDLLVAAIVIAASAGIIYLMFVSGVSLD